MAERSLIWKLMIQDFGGHVSLTNVKEILAVHPHAGSGTLVCKTKQRPYPEGEYLSQNWTIPCVFRGGGFCGCPRVDPPGKPMIALHMLQVFIWLAIDADISQSLVYGYFYVKDEIID